jgi:signal transduction histidine kinase/ActR/RegA family two-component response regulator
MMGAGLARALGSGEWESWTKAQGLPSSLVWNIRRDKKGAMWVATSMGVTRLQGKLPARTWGSKDGLGGENVRWLGETLDGAIWAIPKPGGLSRIDPATGIVRTLGLEDGLGQKLNRGLVDHLGRLWVAAADGLFRNDAPCSSTRFAKVNPPGVLEKGTWAVSEDNRGTVWVIGPDGLWRLQQDQWRRYRKSDGLLTDNPYIAVVGADNSLWLRNRFDAGVERLEFDGDRISRATAIVPSANTSVDVTAFHGFDTAGDFWRGTAKGVAVLHDGAWTQYSTEDGLIWDDCDGEAFWADPDGSVWIGTSGGVSHYRPPKGQPPEAAANPIVTSLEIRRQPRLVRVSFSSLNYRYDQLVRFGYRFDDGLWTETPERSISIAGLGPGRHRIEIRSRIRDGPFSPKPAVAEFDVEPLWSESWWFRCLALLLASLLIWGGVLWRHRALHRRNAILERAVQQRTVELAAERSKVLEEKQRADDASAAKGQFLANMSHEIRTPLNGLLGLTQLLEDARDPEDLSETIRLIRSSGQMLLGVINDILDFSKVEAGKLELEITPFELRSTLEDAVGLFRASAAEKGLRLHLALAPDLPGWVAGDHIRLRQVVQNLISNSLKFTHSGEIALTAAVAAQEATPQKETTPEESAHCIRVEVRDTGIGIPPDKIKQLFSSFSQADASISRRYGGTGLGLAICKRLVHLMGGNIDVQSQPGEGSTFRFTVLLGRATAPAPALDMPPGLEVGKLRVLLVEDNKINQIVGLRLLEKLGVAADLAENGEEAVAAAERTSYDLILMDVQMPVMDGIAATHAIRTNLTGNPQPFICGLSAHATTDFQEICLDSGMDGYLIKPLDIQKLQVLLAQRCAQSAI